MAKEYIEREEAIDLFWPVGTENARRRRGGSGEVQRLQMVQRRKTSIT